MSLEESLKTAFGQMAMLDGQPSVMDGSQNIFDQQQANSFIPSLMLEYISPKYEEDSFNEIEESIKELKDVKELEGISTKMTDKGLLITFDDKYLFSAGSAVLDTKAQKMLDKVGVLICKKFVLHSMRVEGHTDSQPINSDKFPSNWELSTARATNIIAYILQKNVINPKRLSAVGYGEYIVIVESDIIGICVNVLLLHYSVHSHYHGIALLDLCYPHFKRIVCVFMYMLPDLDHLKPYHRYAQVKYPRCEWLQVPHYALYSYIKTGYLGCECNPSQRLWKLVNCSNHE